MTVQRTFALFTNRSDAYANKANSRHAPAVAYKSCRPSFRTLITSPSFSLLRRLSGVDQNVLRRVVVAQKLLRELGAGEEKLLLFRSAYAQRHVTVTWRTAYAFIQRSASKIRRAALRRYSCTQSVLATLTRCVAFSIHVDTISSHHRTNKEDQVFLFFCKRASETGSRCRQLKAVKSE